MKLLYSLNKTDVALDLFMKDAPELAGSKKTALTLMNKLATEKRYDDVLKVYAKIFEKKVPEDLASLNTVLGQIINLVAESLYQKVKQQKKECV